MRKNIQLLLVENVDNLGIVGDVVTVRLGYARNFLLPFGLATSPSDELLAQLQEKRKKAQAELAALRKQREGMVERLHEHTVTLVRACNDQGVLYGGVTQQDVAKALTDGGFAVSPRDVRLPHAIKRVETYDVLIKFASDLETTIKLVIEADRAMDEDEREEMEFDNEGELIEKPRRGERGRRDGVEKAAGSAAGEAAGAASAKS